MTHLATNGAGTIHDWELAFLGRTEESVRKNVATGTFGTWDETGRCIHLALLAGALQNEGYGRSLGRFICEDGVTLPTTASLEKSLRDQPADPLAPARAELLQAMLAHRLPAGRMAVQHPWKETSILAQAFRHNVPFTVHPGIGYDIIATHPMFSGAAIGRAAAADFRLFGRAVEGLDGGVVLSVGSAIMAPQVFEKSISCVNNLRRQAGRQIVHDHTMYVVDIQDGGNWDWSKSGTARVAPAVQVLFHVVRNGERIERPVAGHQEHVVVSHGHPPCLFAQYVRGDRSRVSSAQAAPRRRRGDQLASQEFAREATRRASPPARRRAETRPSSRDSRRRVPCS